MTAKRPSLQFYPDDWLSDPALRRCSSSARGVWIDLICVMHGGEPYGHLRTGGSSFTVAEVARVVGEPVPKVKRALDELERNGVCSRTDAGVLFSRRMVRDEGLRSRRAAGGELGADAGERGRAFGKLGGRPKKTPDETPLHGGNGRGIEEPPPSSSSSSSSSSGSETQGKKRRRREVDSPPPPASGDEPKPENVKLVEWFQVAWTESGRPEPYVYARKDFALAAKLLALPGIKRDEIRRRARIMLGSLVPFHRTRASIGLLLSHWNDWPSVEADRAGRNEPKGFAAIREIAAEQAASETREAAVG